MSLSARLPGERVTFLSGKVTKAIGAEHDGLANIRLARLPCASRRARAGANSYILVLKQSRLSRAPGCDARRHVTAPNSLRHGHPWPAIRNLCVRWALPPVVRATHSFHFR